MFITLYKYLHISAHSSFYPCLYPVSHLTTFPSCHPQFLIALHWLFLSGFFCPPSTDPERTHMLLAFNPHLASTICCISISSVSVCALPSTHLKTSVPGCSPFTNILQYFSLHGLLLHPEDEGYSETLVNLYQIARCHIPDDSTFSHLLREQERETSVCFVTLCLDKFDKIHLWRTYYRLTKNYKFPYFSLSC